MAPRVSEVAAALRPRTHVTHAWVPVLLLLGSGFSALVYQILWLRLLGLVFVVTVHAASTVLAAFMAGLAIGSVAGGRIADRSRVPLRWFGIAELLIGATALSTPWLFDGLDVLYRHVYASMADDGRVLTAVRFGSSLAVLIVPTTLMGATMPLVLRSAVAHAGQFGTRAATLYAANTTGALAGAFVTGYYLVSSIGIAATFQLAAVVNLAVGVTALLWPVAANATTPPQTACGDTGQEDKSRRLILITVGVSGFVGLALEIIWFRALVMFLPATTYVFTTILTLVLGGIAAGSALATRMLRHERDWVGRLAVLQAAVAISAVASLAAQAWTYSHGWRTGATLQASALSVLPAMIFMGAAFPIGLHCWTRSRKGDDGRIGDRVGRFYLVNLSGAIAGAVAAGFGLIPWLGTRMALIFVAALSLLSGLAWLRLVGRRRPRYAAVIGLGSLALFIAIALALPDPLDAVLARRYGGERPLWREEGAQATVSVQQGRARVMYLDGLHQANDSPAMLGTHRQIGTLAMALHRRPADALVIGLGGGATAGAVAQFADASVDVIELSPSVAAAAELFRHANGNVLRRPNVR